MPELSDRASSLLRFLRKNADAERVVRPESGVTYQSAASKWAEAEVANPPGGIRVGGLFEASSDDFEEVVSELVLKGYLDVPDRFGFRLL